MLREAAKSGEGNDLSPLDLDAGTSVSVGEMPGGDLSFLKSVRRSDPGAGQPLRWVDLFSGIGAMSLGAAEAARAQGRRAEVAFALDSSARAAEVFRENFAGTHVAHADVGSVFSGCDRGPLSQREISIKAKAGLVDLVIGGPPCQGHSDLNNFSRRNDPRNRLYPYMARAAQVFAPKAILIENVRGVPHDRAGVLAYTSDYLKELGYFVSDGVLDASHFGIAQKRLRHFLLATRKPVPSITELVAPYAVEPRTIRWAIGDLVDVRSNRLIDRASKPSADNLRRIAHLFEHELFELPDAERPKCHRDKAHTYRSVYGRLRWDDQAQTITSGFYSMCMGRYVHPARQRTLTAHEAARLQFIPDSFSFNSVKSRTSLAEMIGNAVPPKLSYVVVRALIKIGLL